jgi:hypothetical protein
MNLCQISLKYRILNLYLPILWREDTCFTGFLPFMDYSQNLTIAGANNGYSCAA